ncbi:MAG TPA: glucosaminidase domain-containing protein, partial [Streptosporangiaceae bacterium]|nr:glucosaminidase domain-containing protein [Streptosporangiaceae bacterium]
MTRMHSARKPWWQQATALVNISAGGVVTGISFVPAAAAAAHTPAGTQIQLMALEQSGRQAAPSGDAALRSAIVNVAHYYLRMAAHKTPAEMDAIIWRRDSLDGAGHGASCAAFASLTLELAAQVVGQQSWVSGGGTYPWPLHDWADVRVNPNPASPDITSIVQDARAHHRWHPVASGYQPLPGDWVVFDGHVEVITRYAGGVLHSVGADSLPDYSVNAHELADPLADRGVLGFVNNGAQPEAASAPEPGSSQQPGKARQPGSAPEGGSGQAPGGPQPRAPRGTGGAPRHPHAPGSRHAAMAAATGHAAIPGAPGPPAPRRHRGSGWHHVRPARDGRPAGPAKIPGLAAGDQSKPGWRPDRAWSAASIPGLPAVSDGGGHASSHDRAGSEPGSDAAAYRRHHPSPVPAPRLSAAAQQAFIRNVARGALDSQRRYGVPAAVTIAQAIDESGWGRSDLAVRAHNLFGIKGTGPAGHRTLATLEYEHGRRVTRQASFRAYHSVAESIADHGRLLATSHYYRRAMADRHDPNAFAAALTGVYATDPGYGANLIRLMRRYDLYRYDAARNA